MTQDYEYAVRVKNGAGWRRFSCMRLMISVGKEYHEGNKLKAVVEWINRNPSIKKVQVSVNDYLQRHNLIAFGEQSELAENMARLSGTAWMNRNEGILSSLKPDWSFTRWEDWYGTVDYLDAHATILSLAEQDQAFKEVLFIDANSLAERKKRRGELIPPLLVEASYNYVTEELAVFSLQSRALQAAEVYPGTSLKSVQYLFNKELPRELETLSTRYVTRIDFERIKEISSGPDFSFDHKEVALLYKQRNRA